MLTPEAAVVGSVSLFFATLATIHSVTKYDNDFVDTDSYAWSFYAGFFLCACMLTMAMSVVQEDLVAWLAATASTASVTFLCIWISEKHAQKARLLREESSNRLLDTIDDDAGVVA